MKKTIVLISVGAIAVILSVLGVIHLLSDNSPTIEERDPVGSKFRPVTIATSVFSGETGSFPFDVTVSGNQQDSSETEPTAVAEYAYAYAGFNPVYANLDVPDWRLILVNRNYILPEGYMPQLANAVENGYADQKLDYRVAPYFNEMYQAAYEDGINLVPISGYRSYERQERNFENKIDYFVGEGYSRVDATIEASTIILPPGTSEHNAGLAMDICSLEQNFEDTEEFEWLCENAADYGFILRYPEDKQHITQIIYEPWHWRYVGVEAAHAMKASGQCLEEYLGVA